MSTDRPFSHPNAGKALCVEQDGLNVSVTFTLADQRRADEIYALLSEQAKRGYLQISMLGSRPTIVEERGT